MPSILVQLTADWLSNHLLLTLVCQVMLRPSATLVTTKTRPLGWTRTLWPLSPLLNFFRQYLQRPFKTKKNANRCHGRFGVLNFFIDET